MLRRDDIAWREWQGALKWPDLEVREIQGLFSLAFCISWDCFMLWFVIRQIEY